MDKPYFGKSSRLCREVLQTVFSFNMCAAAGGMVISLKDKSFKLWKGYNCEKIIIDFKPGFTDYRMRK